MIRSEIDPLEFRQQSIFIGFIQIIELLDPSLVSVASIDVPYTISGRIPHHAGFITHTLPPAVGNKVMPTAWQNLISSFGCVEQRQGQMMTISVGEESRIIMGCQGIKAGKGLNVPMLLLWKHGWLPCIIMNISKQRFSEATMGLVL